MSSATPSRTARDRARARRATPSRSPAPSESTKCLSRDAPACSAVGVQAKCEIPVRSSRADHSAWSAVDRRHVPVPVATHVLGAGDRLDSSDVVGVQRDLRRAWRSPRAATARLVPGIGTMSGPWWSSHASASCAAVTPLLRAISPMRVATATLASKFPSAKRGNRLRRVSVAASVSGVSAPVRMPRPSGLYATKPMPSSRMAGSTDSSASRANSEYSDCTAEIGCTAFARRMVAEPASLNPRKRTFPASTSSAIAPTFPRSAPSDPAGAGSTGR